MFETEFEKTMDRQIAQCKTVLSSKSHEYAVEDDRLHNFKVAAEMQGCTYARALSGMMAKHTISIYDMCNAECPLSFPKELWNEKITDSINYLLLLNALLSESRSEEMDELYD